MSVKQLMTYADLIEFLSAEESVKVFGAGETCGRLLAELEMENPELLKKIKCITATRLHGKPSQKCNIPLVLYEDAHIGRNDAVLLAMKAGFCNEVEELLSSTGASLARYNPHLIHDRNYVKIFEALSPYIEGFPANAERLLPKPCEAETPRVWTMWWQGVEEAPEIVKACFRSQKRCLPKDVEYTIITKDNYADYVTLPDYILEKVENGSMRLAHLSDIIRWMLLYQYGGLWLDSTILLMEPIEPEIFEYPLYTEKEMNESFGTGIHWTMIFIKAKPGHLLLQFLATMLVECLKDYESIMDLDYLLSDYCIGIAYNIFPEVKRDFDALPISGTMQLLKPDVLITPYAPEKLETFKGRKWAKTTYKIEWGASPKEGSVHEYICKNT